MRKLAMMLVLSLLLQLVAPFVVCADNSTQTEDSSTHTVESETEAKASSTHIVESETETEASSTRIVEGETETEASSTHTGEGETETEASSTHTEGSETEESSAHAEEGETKDGEQLERTFDRAAATEIEGFIQKKYYRKNDGYHLFVGAAMPSWSESITELTNVAYQIDDGTPVNLNTLSSTKFTYKKTWFAYGECLTILLDDIPSMAAEGRHRLTVYFTAGGTAYVMQGMTEFVDEASKTEITISDSNMNTKYVSSKSGSDIFRIKSEAWVDDVEEKITRLQLVKSMTDNAVVDAGVVFNRLQGNDGRYSLVYEGSDGTSYEIDGDLVPEAYNIRASVDKATLENKIDNGYYDILLMTSKGRKIRVKNAYYASDKAIIYSVSVENGASGKDEYGYDDKNWAFFSDNTGNYVSVYVYGLNLGKNNVPTFYDESGRKVLTQYVDGDKKCGYERGDKWGDYYRLKKTDDFISVGTEGWARAVIDGDVIYAYGGSYCSAAIKSAGIFFEEYFAAGKINQGSPGRLRLYIGGNVDCAVGDTVKLELKEGYGNQQTRYDGTSVVRENKNGKYIEFDENSNIYKNIGKSSLMVQLTKDGRVITASRAYPFDWSWPEDLGIRFDWNMSVPAGGRWEIHPVGEIAARIYEGRNTGSGAETLKLTAEQISELSEYGTVRICVYRADGEVSGRRLVYFHGGSGGSKEEAPVIELTNGTVSVNVYDSVTKKPINGAQVTIDNITKNTVANGIVQFTASSTLAQKQIKVTAPGYTEIETYQVAKNKASIRIGMRPDENNVQIMSASVLIGNDNYDLLRRRAVLGYYEKLDELTSMGSNTIVLNIKASKSDVTYELLADDQKIMESTNGSFAINAVTVGKTKEGDIISANMPLMNSFKPGQKICVKATTPGGGSVTEKINLNATYNYLTENIKKQKGSFELKNGIKVKVPDDVPFVGGSEVNVGFEDKMPLEVEISEDGKIRIALNKPTDTKMEDFGKKYMVWEKKYKGKEKTALRQLGNPSNFGAGMVTVSGKVCGYGECDLSERLIGNYTFKLGLMAEIEGKAGYKHYWIIGYTAVKVFVEGSAKGSAALEGTVSFKNGKYDSFDVTGGAFNVKVEVEAGAGVGLTEYVYEIEVSMTGSANYVNKPARKYKKLWLEASGKVSRTAIYFWERTLWESPSYQYTIYQEGEDKPLSAAYAPQGESNGDSGFRLMDRNYLNYRTGYNNLPQTDKLKAVLGEPVGDAANNSNVIKPAVLPSALPTLVESGGTKYLFWADDVPERDAYNRTALMYAKSSDGKNWSSPERLISEATDSTPDFYHDTTVSGSKIYIVWQDASKKLTEKDTITDMLKSVSLRYAVVDATTGTVTDGGQLTDTAGCYLYPSVAAVGDKIYFAYVNSTLDSGSIEGKNTHKLCLVMPDGTKSEIDVPGGAQIVNMDAGTFDGKPCVLCELDTDGDSSTNSDREIFICNFEDAAFSRLTDNQAADSYPVIAESGNLYWFRDNEVVRLSGLQGQPAAVLDARQSACQTAFTVVSDASGKDTILWETSDSSAPDGSVSIFQTSENSDGSWGGVLRFAKTTGTIASRISATGSGDSLQVAHTEGIYLADGTRLKDLCVTSRENNTDIALEYVDFDEKQASAGSALTLKAGVVNNGNTVIDSITFDADGAPISTLAGLGLKPYESREIEVTGFVVPQDIASSKSLRITADVPDEKDLDDNAAEIVLGSPDVYIETGYRVEDGQTWLDVSIYNDSSYEASGTVLVHKGYEDGEVIFSKKYEKLGKDNGYSYSVDLGDYEGEYTKYYAEVTSDTKENNIGNNMEFAYIGYGTGVEQAEKTDEKYEAVSVVLNSQTLQLAIGGTTQLSLKDDKGNAISTEEILWSSDDRRIANVDPNGLVTAYRAGKAQITAHYGDLGAVCAVTVGDVATPGTLTVTFDTQGGDPVSPITGIAPGSTVTLPSYATKSGCIFEGWYTQPSGGDKVENTIAVTESITLYAHWKDAQDGLWISGIDESGYYYTGDAIKPDIQVYDHTTLLTEKIDYTLSFKNNVRAGTATVTVNGRGNYSGTETATFEILRVAIDGAEVRVMDFCVKTGSKAQKPVPEIYYMGTKLKNKSDFTISYASAPDIYSSEGEYDVPVTGMGNYTGTRVLKLKAVSQITKQKTVSISGARFNFFERAFTYTGQACRQPEYCRPIVKVSGYEMYLEEGVDYTAVYTNNVKAGTATVIYYGLNNFTGKIKKTFKILPYDIDNYEIKHESDIECVYAKGGARPRPVIRFGGKTLKEGRDYTLSWKNNGSVYGNGLPSIIASGRGNFKGKRTIHFSIVKQDLSNMTLTQCDKVYKSKAGIYKITPKLMDLDGRLLSAGKDYDAKNITYTYEGDVVLENNFTKKAGDAVANTDIIPAGTEIRVTINAGTGDNYKGTFTGTYRITQASISAASVTIPRQTYTGGEITPDKSQLTVKIGNTTLSDNDYDIVGYTDNVKKGTAYVTIKGKNNYGGTKKAKFSIGAKGFLWWWKK